MADGRDDAAREIAPAKDAQFAPEFAFCAGDADIGGAARDGADHLRRVRLQQMQVDQRIRLAKVLDDRQQCVACVRVRGGDRQPAAGLILQALVGMDEIIDFQQHPAGGGERGVACSGEADNPAADPHQQFRAEFQLQAVDLLADPRLRDVQRLRRAGDAESIVDDGTEKFQLFEPHRLTLLLWLRFIGWMQISRVSRSRRVIGSPSLQ